MPKTFWLIFVTLFLITAAICLLIVQHAGIGVYWYRFWQLCGLFYSPFLIHWILISINVADILQKPERFLKLLLYIMLCGAYGSGLTFGGMFWVFTMVSVVMFFMLFITFGSWEHPECFRTWSDLKKINNKVVWDILKI